MYCLDKRVEVNDVVTRNDGSIEASMVSLVNYFQNCCLFQAEDLGIGLDFLNKENMVWVLNGWQIDVERFPKYAEKIHIWTRPYDIKGFMGFRNFYILDENESVLARANSIWTLLSTENFMPIKVPPMMIESYKKGDKLDMEYAPRKIDIPDNIKKGKSIEVMHHHLDVNGHVNNGQYVAMALNILPNEFRAKHLRTEYKSQARLNDVLTPYISTIENGYVITLNDQNDKNVAVIEFKG